MSADIVRLPIYNFRRPADMLRRIADEIERGDHGPNPELTVCLLGKHFGLYAAGEAFESASVSAGAAAILCTAALRVLSDHVVNYQEP